MSDLPKHVLIAEEGPREGFQIEPGPIPTDRKIALVDALSQTGLTQIQVASFVSPKRVPGMADADAVAAGITPRPGVEYSALWFNTQGLERARRIDKLTLSGKLRAYASDAFLKRNLDRTPAEHEAFVLEDIAALAAAGIPITEASVTAAFGCNFQGDIAVETVLGKVAWMMRLVAEHQLPITCLSLADTMAWATPRSIRALVGAVREAYPDVPVSLHLHDTRGMGIANVATALEMGVALFDSAIGGLGGCPFAAHKGAAGNVCTEDMVFLCEEMGIETGVDLEALIECAELAESIVGHPLPGSVKQGGSLSRLRSSGRV